MKPFAEITVGFIGAGNMAEAIVRGLIQGGNMTPERLLASDVAEERRRIFAEQFGVRVVEDNRSVVAASEVVVVAVKPQMLAAALETVHADWRPGQLLISIAAGVRAEKLDAACGGVPAIIRVMPNTPALVGQGLSAYARGPRANPEHGTLTEALFATVGDVLCVDETAMDAVTAISGSGPAYVFYWLEAMLAAAGDLGFDPVTARRLVYQTLSGSAALAAASSEAPETLRARVTSKGGTTEAAIRTLEEGRVKDNLVAAIHAAAARSRELSNL
ncbi:MAG TPA: pyrroline-5-carboxylate reductase [Kiritimatiellia bacterium]|nr:pyrroline-5-carboxylate reductase [Kiritimatiellia bacterium]HMO97716.1 pyrroline-5-carboxylate reductase [Kiritimatiellia bacterium]